MPSDTDHLLTRSQVHPSPSLDHQVAEGTLWLMVQLEAVLQNFAKRANLQIGILPKHGLLVSGTLVCATF